MELKVSYRDKEIEYEAGDKRGEGLEGLIDFIGKAGSCLKKVEIIGESKSYTFLRQIYLLANMVAVLSESSVWINKKKIAPDKLQFPLYPKNF